MFCCILLYDHSSFAIILMGKKELIALLGLSSWCLVMVVWLFFAVPCFFLRFVSVFFPDHTHLLFSTHCGSKSSRYTLVNVNAPVVAKMSWWLHFSAQVVA